MGVKLASLEAGSGTAPLGEAPQGIDRGGAGGRRLSFVRAICRMAMLAIVLAGVVPACAVEAINVRTRRAGDRPHRRRRAPAHRRRPHPGLGRARPRRHRPPHGRARARRQHQLGGVRARQYRRRADRPADRRAALPHGRLGPVLARSRPVARRQHHARAGDRPDRQDSADRRHLPHHARSRHGR